MTTSDPCGIVVVENVATPSVLTTAVPSVALVVAVLVLFWKLAAGNFVTFLDRISPFHIGTPRISGTVVNAVTGRPVPGMDVCLLVTHIPDFSSTP
jgi:hypothetical protein